MQWVVFSCACCVRNVIWPGNAPPATDWSAPIVSGEQLQQQQQQFPSWHLPQPEHFSPFPARDAWNTFHNSPGFNGLPVYSGEQKEETQYFGSGNYFFMQVDSGSRDRSHRDNFGESLKRVTVMGFFLGYRFLNP